MPHKTTRKVLGFLGELFSGKKKPTGSKKRPVSPKRKAPVAGRARVGPKTMQRSPKRKGIQTSLIGTPTKHSGRSVVRAKKKAQVRRHDRFISGLSRNDR